MTKQCVVCFIRSFWTVPSMLNTFPVSNLGGLESVFRIFRQNRGTYSVPYIPLFRMRNSVPLSSSRLSFVTFFRVLVISLSLLRFMWWWEFPVLWPEMHPEVACMWRICRLQREIFRGREPKLSKWRTPHVRRVVDSWQKGEWRVPHKSWVNRWAFYYITTT